MKNDNTPLPAGIEAQLKHLEARHAAHQAMLERHREEKHQRRQWHRFHRQRGHKANGIPVALP